MRNTSPTIGQHEFRHSSIPFPGVNRRGDLSPSPAPTSADTLFEQTCEDVFAAISTASRRMHDLARELNCLGYFEDDLDRPRAA